MSVESARLAASGGSTRFTVVIPTRERADTLYWTLLTCLGQDYENLEIIVSDNYSQDTTREVVAAFGDPRLRYVNTGHRLGMTSNWEFALAHVRDGFVTYLGDDDGLLPDALSELDRIITAYPEIEAVAWQKADYSWPSRHDRAFRDTLSIPLRRSLDRCDSAAELREVLAFRKYYPRLPTLYNSVVSLAAIRRATPPSGQFFHSIIPDVYSGVVLASVLSAYVFSTLPFSVNGVSGHSAGASFLFNTWPAGAQPAAPASTPEEQDSTAAHRAFLQENELQFHAKLAFAPSIPLLTVESLLQAQEQIDAARAFTVDYPALLLAVAQEAAGSLPEKYAALVDALRHTAQLHDLAGLADELIARFPNQPEEVRPTIGYNVVHNTVRLRTLEFGVRNIYAASLLCKHVLVLRTGSYFGVPSVLRTSAEFANKVGRRWLLRQARARRMRHHTSSVRRP